MQWIILTKVLGAIMILVIFIVILIVQPPVGMAAKETVLPTASMSDIFPAILTLLGGTVVDISHLQELIA